MNNNMIVTVREFVTALMYSKHSNPKYRSTDSFDYKTMNYLDYGYHLGWLTDLDINNADTPLLRKDTARIIHEFLRLELQVPDIDDVSSANKLRDLYDCRVCAKHVMQVYARGIMDGFHITDTLYIFGMNETLTISEMHTIISRTFEAIG